MYSYFVNTLDFNDFKSYDVADALSHKLANLVAYMVLKEWQLLEQVTILNAGFKVNGKKVCGRSLKVHLTLLFEFKEIQETDKYFRPVLISVKKVSQRNFILEMMEFYVIKVKYVSLTIQRKEKILKKAHQSRYSVHQEGPKCTQFSWTLLMK